jgi:putative hydrolase of the HAD superfamily
LQALKKKSMVNFPECENVIFDLGGVLLDISYQRTEDAFVAMGIENFRDLYSQAQQTSLFNDLEEGKISPTDFRNELRNLSGLDLKDSEIDYAWNAMLGRMPQHRIESLEELKNKFKLYLLSNTNEIHIPAFKEIMKRDGLLERFEACFEKTYYSSEIGRRKPNKEAFDFVCQTNGLDKSKTAFIDDSIQHVEGARAAGLKANHLEEGMEFSSFFEKS